MINVLMAAALFRLGSNEAKLLSYPHANLVPEYIPTAQRISYCMNLPPFVARNLVGNLIVRRSPVASEVWDKWVYSSRFQEGANYYVLAFLFWWWIGWRVDVKDKPRDPRPSVKKMIGYSFGVLLSLILLYVGGNWFADASKVRFVGGFLMPGCAFLWGIGFLYYFGKELLPRKRQQRGIPQQSR